MIRLALAAAFAGWLLFAAGLRAAETAVSFREHVLPALTKAGCNAGACHGSPSGKNGFRLSLRGYDPKLDIDTLTREAQGRRVNRLDPDASLVLLKATGQMPHEGGRRFDRASPLYALIRDWIAQGGADDSATAPKVLRLEAIPSLQLVSGNDRPQPLRVTAYLEGGKTRDVTQLARFAAHDETVAAVDADGQAEKRKTGESALIVEYRGMMATARVVFLDDRPGLAWPDPPVNDAIDRLVFAKLKLLGIEPSPLATDEEFLRRAYLDAIGKLPTPAEVKLFLNDARADKRSRLIDELLGRPEFADWWAMKWTDRLGCNQRFVGKIGAIKYHQWIRHCLAVNMPEDQLVRAILTAQGGNYGNPPAGFYRRLRDPQTRAEEIAQLFMGVRVQCARCHNHPGESWTQDDYHGLAAFFGRIRYRDGPFFVQLYDKEETVYLARDGEVTQPRTGQVMVPRFLDGSAAACAPDADRREVFADWLTRPDNPYFARAAVNRIWFHLLGRGIVDPVDDMRSTNPPSIEGLLELLAADLAEHGFDRKHLIRRIMNSRVYQLSSRTTATNADDEKFFSHARVRLLQAEQLLDAMCSATGTAEKFPGQPAGASAVTLADGEYKHPFLEAFGRPARAMACECERDLDTNLGQALQLVGGRTVQDKIASDSGRVARLLGSGRKDDEVLEELFLATLSRYPTPDESRLLVGRLSGASDRRRAAEDILWALINHREFLFQH